MTQHAFRSYFHCKKQHAFVACRMVASPTSVACVQVASGERFTVFAVRHVQSDARGIWGKHEPASVQRWQLIFRCIRLFAGADAGADAVLSVKLSIRRLRIRIRSQ